MSQAYVGTAPGWVDGFGRRAILESGGERRLRLQVRPELLAQAPLFETSVRLAAARTGAALAPDRALAGEVGRAPNGALVITGPAPLARRIAGWLDRAARASRPLPVDAAVTMTLRIMASVIAFHASMKTAHGTLSIERTWVQRDGAVVLADGIFAEGLETLGWGRERLWRELRIAMPPAASLPRFDPRADLTQVAVIVLELLLGRSVTADEYPHAIVDLVNEATSDAAVLPTDRVASGLRMWLQRALPIHPRAAFTSMADAHASLEQLARETDIARTGRRALAQWLDPTAAADTPRPIAFASPPPIAAPLPSTALEDDASFWRRLLPFGRR